MFLTIPYHVDVPMRRRPWMNWVLIGVTVGMYPVCTKNGMYPVCTSKEDFTSFGKLLILGEGPLGWFGHVLVHGGWLHLFGNMLFLWVFGNAVCAKIGNLAYLFVYFGSGIVTGLVSQMVDPRPAAGASGAINGVVGMFVVWYLLNEVSCWVIYGFLGWVRAWHCSVSSYWLVLLWAVFDIVGLICDDEPQVGYVAHLAGLILGLALAVVMLKTGWVKMARGERSLLEVLPGSNGQVRSAGTVRRKTTPRSSDPSIR